MDDPRIKMWLDQWEEDLAEGKTVRALHERLAEHQIHDDRRFDQLTSLTSRIAERVTRVETNDERDAEERISGTGNHRIVMLPPPPSPVSKRPSAPPWLSKALQNTVTKVLLLLAAATAGAILRHFAGH